MESTTAANEEMPVEKILEAEMAVEQKTELQADGSSGGSSVSVCACVCVYTHTHPTLPVSHLHDRFSFGTLRVIRYRATSFSRFVHVEGLHY